MEKRKIKSQTITRKILRPVISVMMRLGIGFKEFRDISQDLFVNVAEDEYGLGDRKTNTTRIAIIAGMARGTVTSIQKAREKKDLSEYKPVLGPATRLLTTWNNDPQYADKEGKPLILSLYGERPSLMSLITDQVGDITPTAIIKELANTGAIERLEGDRYRVLMRNFFPTKQSPEQLHRATIVMGDLYETINHNLLYGGTDTKTRFEAIADNYYLKDSDIPKFDLFVRTKGQQFLEEVDEWLTEHEDTSEENHSPVRLGIGVYFIKE